MAWKFSGKSDVYVQIAEKYENYIKLGVLKNGEKLPSVRTAAEELVIFAPSEVLE